jgi:chemotaxis methyl-accepting protein methylase
VGYCLYKTKEDVDDVLKEKLHQERREVAQRIISMLREKIGFKEENLMHIKVSYNIDIIEICVMVYLESN